VVVVLFVAGLKKVQASLGGYALVPNGPKNVCYKVGTDYTDFSQHLSCTTHEKVCETSYGVIVGCQTRRPIDLN